MEKVMKKLKKYVKLACEILELIAAGLVLIGILLSILSIVSEFAVFRDLMNNPSAFKTYLEEILMIIIGVEFLQMLCRPSSENVIEVLIFLVARHMIVGDTSPYQDFVSVISVTLLCVLRRFLRNDKEHRRTEKRIAQKEETDDKMQES